MALLKGILEKLQQGEALGVRYKNHPLTGQWSGNFDCHIQPDRILIYRLTEDALILEAMGTHADLFD
ncbi:MAG: type II toxin-antitoxin system YafQ family toxin [bacterium]